MTAAAENAARRPAGEARVLLVLPCHNEAEAIGGLLQEIRALRAGYDTLVIDDGSTDETYRIARERSPCVRLGENLGIGGAVHTGIRYAHRRGYDFCVQVDGDGQHPPDQVRLLLETHQREGANIIIGSRYIDGQSFRSSLPRRTGSRVIGRWLRTLYGQAVTDPTSGMRLLDREAIAFFAEAYPHDFPEPISLARAMRHGLAVREVPVKMRVRQGGRSSITSYGAFFYMVRVLGYVALSRLEPGR